MKLQKQTSRKIGDKTYDKYVVIIPIESVKEAGWLDGETLHYKVVGNAIVISPSIISDAFDSCEQSDGRKTN